MSVIKKQFRVAQLIAVCVKRNITPKNNNGFCDYILRVAATYYACEKRVGRNYVNVLIQAFKFDKWKSLVIHNEFLNEEEKKQWINTHS